MSSVCLTRTLCLVLSGSALVRAATASQLDLSIDLELFFTIHLWPKRSFANFVFVHETVRRSLGMLHAEMGKSQRPDSSALGKSLPVVVTTQDRRVAVLLRCT